MIRPVDFKFNTQTAANNRFQVQPGSLQEQVQQRALAEFDAFAGLLRHEGVNVTIVNDTLDPETPDSIFPNNWISLHEDGRAFLYPMFSENRRKERRDDIIQLLATRFRLSAVEDLSSYENTARFLEGTGSMVLDRDHKIAYACRSQRTDAEVLHDFCARAGYRPVVFSATDASGFPIYHTNVMMCVGDGFVLACFDALPLEAERRLLLDAIRSTGKETVGISLDQMNRFAGNMLQLQGRSEKLIVMSEQAFRSLLPAQAGILEKYGKLIYAPLTTIETNGGGSARCMLAEIHLPEN
ncbi:citrulline utilization hydrolase CtlX [Pedobacter yulinensis]|nr:arginine deiminase-related protein [Pedobacter yulinensis]